MVQVKKINHNRIMQDQTNSSQTTTLYVKSGLGSYKQSPYHLITANLQAVSFITGWWTIQSIQFTGDFDANEDGEYLNTYGQHCIGLSFSSSETFDHYITRISALFPDHQFYQSAAIACARAICTLFDHTFPSLPEAQKQIVPWTSIISYDEAVQRWTALPSCVLIPPSYAEKSPLSIEENLALDEACLHAVATGVLPPLIRFWSCYTPAVAIGKFQSVSHEINIHKAVEQKYHIVRRMTGGGTMIIEPHKTLLYSVILPTSIFSFLTAEQRYVFCDSWVFHSFDHSSVPLYHEPINDLSSPYGKVGGAAAIQWINGSQNALLHHTALSYEASVAAFSSILQSHHEKYIDKTVKSAQKRVAPLSVLYQKVGKRIPSWNMISQQLANSAQTLIPHHHIFHLTDIPISVQTEMQRLVRTKYSTKQWTYRIP